MNPSNDSAYSDEYEDSPMDLKLQAFLRQNKPPVPEASPKLEGQLMAQIEQEKNLQVSQRTSKSWRSISIGLGLLLIGGLLWQVQRWMSPADYSIAELDELESFILSTWGNRDDPADPLSDWDDLGESSSFELSSISPVMVQRSPSPSPNQ